MSASEILQGMVGSTTIRNSWLYWIRCVQSLGLESGELLLPAPLSLSLPHDCDWILTGFFFDLLQFILVELIHERIWNSSEDDWKRNHQ